MNSKQKLSYMAMGAVIMAVGIGLGTFVSPPLVAQRNGVFDEIQCSKLAVVNEAGQRSILLEDSIEEGASVTLYNLSGKMGIQLSSNAAFGNTIKVLDDQGKHCIKLYCSTQFLRSITGDGIFVYNEDGKVQWRAPEHSWWRSDTKNIR